MEETINMTSGNCLSSAPNAQIEPSRKRQNTEASDTLGRSQSRGVLAFMNNLADPASGTSSSVPIQTGRDTGSCLQYIRA